MSAVIEQFVGLRQGCILSPCLFSLFIADLPEYLRNLDGIQACRGVPFHDTTVHVLMYADDLVLVARTPADLQRLFDALREYCALWHLTVNVMKTKVVVFDALVSGKIGGKRAAARREVVRNLAFTYNGATVEIVNKFKYLGVMFHENVECTCTASTVAGMRVRKYSSAIAHRIQAGRGCLARWMRQCRTWIFQPNLVINLFKTWVMPAFEYGVGFWGVELVRSSSKDSTWKDVDEFWLRVARHVLHVPSKTPIAAIQGELGWYSFSLRAGWQLAELWSRTTRMHDTELLRKAMIIQRSLVQRGKPCWLGNFRGMMYSLGEQGTCIWAKWFEGSYGEIPLFESRTTYIMRRVEGVDVCIPFVDDIVRLMREKENSEWISKVRRIEAQSGVGLNKLRTYALFKQELSLEPYLEAVTDIRKRVLLTKFRTGVAPLRIETGRYERPRIEANLRVCACCGSAVEDEMHFVMECVQYTSRRNVFIQQVRSYADHDTTINIPNNDASDQQMFIFLFTSASPFVCRALADFIWDAFKIRDSLLNM